MWWLFPVSVMYRLPVLSLVRQFLFTTVPWGTRGYQPPQGPGGNWPQVKAVGIEPGHDFQSIVWGFWKEQSSLVAISDMVLPVIVTEESSMPSVLCPQPVLSQEVFSSPNPLAVLASASYWAWQQESWRTAFPLHHHLLPPLPLLVPFRHGSGTAFPFVNLRPSRCP